MSKEYLEGMYKAFICVGIPVIIVFVAGIYFEIVKQNKWLREGEEIDNIGKN